MRSLLSLSSRSRKSVVTRSPKLGIAFLEDRTVPAVVNASLAGGVLTLTAQDAASTEDLVITDAGMPDKFHIWGAGTTDIKYLGVTAPAQDIAGVKSIVIKLKGAADSVNLQGIHLANNVSIDAGAGNNNLTFSNGTDIGGSASVFAGADDDILSINNTHIAKNLVVDQGGNVNWNLCNVFGNSVIGGHMTVTGSAGKELVLLQMTNIGTYLDAQLGSGDDTFSLNDVVVGTNVSAALGNGNDKADITNSAIGGNLTVLAGAGDDSFFLDDTQVSGNVSASMSDGDDKADMQGALISGNTTVGLGNGPGVGNLFYLDANGTASTGSNLAGSLTIAGGSGSDAVRMGKTNPVQIGGVVSINLGDKADIVAINDTKFLNKVNIDFGNGVDALLIEQLNTAANATTLFAKKLTATMGSGNDTVALGIPADAERKVFFSVMPAINGNGGLDVIDRANGEISGTDFTLVAGWYNNFETVI